MSSLPTLGYWECRGLGEPIRYLLHYVGVSFNDKRYQFGHGNSFADMEKIKEPWRKDKNELALDFPNLPYYIEGDLKLTQSLTILRYLARKHGLMAKDERTLARQELIEQQLLDIFFGLISIAIHEDYNQRKSIYIRDTLRPQLQSFSKFLGSNDWLTTDFSYVDIMGYEMIDRIRLFTPQTIAEIVENLKPIKEYQKSSSFKNWPLFSPVVQWGGQGEHP